MADTQPSVRNKYIITPPAVSILEPPPYPGVPNTASPNSAPITQVTAPPNVQPTPAPVETLHSSRQVSTLPHQNSSYANLPGRSTTPPGQSGRRARSLLHRATSSPAGPHEAPAATPAAGSINPPTAPISSGRPELAPLNIAGQPPVVVADPSIPSIPPPPASPSPPPYPGRFSFRGHRHGTGGGGGGGGGGRGNNYANYTGGPQVFYGNEPASQRATVVVTRPPAPRTPPAPRIKPSPTIAICAICPLIFLIFVCSQLKSCASDILLSPGRVCDGVLPLDLRDPRSRVGRPGLTAGHATSGPSRARAVLQHRGNRTGCHRYSGSVRRRSWYACLSTSFLRER